jgi:hypothetical protein
MNNQAVGRGCRRFGLRIDISPSKVKSRSLVVTGYGVLAQSLVSAATKVADVYYSTAALRVACAFLWPFEPMSGMVCDWQGYLAFDFWARLLVVRTGAHAGAPERKRRDLTYIVTKYTYSLNWRQ